MAILIGLLFCNGFCNSLLEAHCAIADCWSPVDEQIIIEFIDLCLFPVPTNPRWVRQDVGNYGFLYLILVCVCVRVSVSAELSCFGVCQMCRQRGRSTDLQVHPQSLRQHKLIFRIIIYNE